MIRKIKFTLFLFSGAELSNDGRYVMLMIREGCEPVNRMYVCDLEKIGYKINGKQAAWISTDFYFLIKIQLNVLIFLTREIKFK